MCTFNACNHHSYVNLSSRLPIDYWGFEPSMRIKRQDAPPSSYSLWERPFNDHFWEMYKYESWDLLCSLRFRNNSLASELYFCCVLTANFDHPLVSFLPLSMVRGAIQTGLTELKVCPGSTREKEIGLGLSLTRVATCQPQPEPNPGFFTELWLDPYWDWVGWFYTINKKRRSVILYKQENSSITLYKHFIKSCQTIVICLSPS